MGIDIIWFDPEGRQLDVADDSSEILSEVIERIRNARELRGLLLATIDPCGTTTFAPPQTATLRRELETIRDGSSVEERVALSPFLVLLHAAEAEPQGCVMFEGD